MKRGKRKSIEVLVAGAAACSSLLASAAAFPGYALAQEAGSEKAPTAAAPDVTGSPQSAPADKAAATAPAAAAPAQDVLSDINSPEWQEEYRQFNELVQRYADGVGLFRKDVDRIIDAKFKEEQERIQKTYDSRYEKLDDELRVRREQAIAAFERFIQKYPSSVHTPLALFRLAELYYDEASYAFIAAQNEYDEKTSRRDPNDTSPLPPEPRYEFARCMVLYDRILRDFPNFENIDAVHYMRGYLFGTELSSLYNADLAKDAWQALIDSYPDSEYASQAYLRIGEYYFDRGTKSDLKTAIERYTRVMSFRDTWYDRALYKVAWSYYKLNDFPNAISNFIALLDESVKQQQEKRKESDLKAEGVEYLAISFADSGTIDDALAYFDKIGERPYKFEVLKKLADVYYKQAKFEESIATYERLQQLYPNSADNPTFQQEIVLLYQRMPVPDIPKALEAKEKLVKEYSPDSSWATSQGLDRASVTRASDIAQTMLAELAYHYHELANKATNDADRVKNYTLAADKYAEYLSRFPYAKNAFELQFFYAECLYNLQRFDEAALEYEKAMASTDPRYHADAAFGRVDSYQKLVRIKEGEDGVSRFFADDPGVVAEPKDGQAKESSTAAVPFSSLKKRYVQAIDVFSKVASTNPDVPNFQFIAAQMFYFHRQYEEAIKRYQGLIDTAPANPLAVVSAINLVDCLLRQQKWREVQDSVERLVTLELGGGGRPWSEARAELDKVRIIAVQKEAEELVKADKADEAYRKFLEANTDIATLNAAKIMDSTGRVDKAIETYQLLIKNFPKSEHVPFSLYRIASNYEKFFELPKAIEYYERLAATYPKFERAPLSLYNAALLRIGLRQYKEAARLYERYATEYPAQSDAEFIMALSVRYFGKAEDYNEVVRSGRNYLQKYGRAHGDRSVETYVSVMNALDKLGRSKESYEMEKKASTLLAGVKDLPTFSPKGVNLYASIAFREIQRTLDAFLALKLTGSEKQLADALERKIKLGQELEAHLRDMVKLGDLEWSTAAIFSVGLMYQSFADALRGAIPPGLSQEEEDIYRQTLEDEYIYPFEDKALERYRQNLELESRQKIWNKWIEQTYVQLNRLRPDLYPARKKEIFYFEPGEQRFLAPPVSTLPGKGVSLRKAEDAPDERLARAGVE